MGEGDSFGRSSPIMIGLFSLLVGTAFYILGYFSTGWYKTQYLGQEFSEGLWEICTTRPSVSGDGWHESTQAMMSIGLIGILTSIVIALLFIFVGRLKEYRKLLIFALLIVICLTVLFSLIGLIIYGKHRKSPHWSFAMTTIGSILALVAGVCTCIQICIQVRSGS